LKTGITLLLCVLGLHSVAQPITQPITARYLPLGAYSKTHADVYATRNNAASLAQLQQSSAAVYAERRFALSPLNLFNFSAGFLTKDGAFALHGHYFGFGLFSQSQFSLAYGRKISDKADAGIQFNYHSLRQGNGYGNASSINASAGVIFHVTDKLHTGIHIYNPTGSRWSKAGNEKIPAQFTFGAGYDVSENLYLSAEIVKEENFPAAVNAGIQYHFDEPFFVRAGISTATSAYFASVGFQMNVFRVDIAASYQPLLGISPGMLLLFNMGTRKSADPEPAAISK
jgi:hypothetical protein